MLLLPDLRASDPSTQSYYELLGVAKDADAKTIRRAFRRLSKLHHPDQGGDAAMFQRLREAYSVLMDEEQRFAYDALGFTASDLKEALASLTTMVVAAYARGATTQRAVKLCCADIIAKSVEKVRVTLRDSEKIIRDLQSIVDDVNESNFVMKQLVVKFREQLAEEHAMVKKNEHNLEIFGIMLKLLPYFDWKRKGVFWSDPTETVQPLALASTPEPS